MGRMSSRLSGKNFPERFSLRRGGPLVQVQGYLPFRLEHVTWGMNSQDSIQPVQLCVTEPSLVNMPGDQHSAVRRSRRAKKHTRTRHFAVTGLEISAGDLPLNVRC